MTEFVDLLTETVQIASRSELDEDSAGVTEYEWVAGSAVPTYSEQSTSSERVGGQDTVSADRLFFLQPDVVVSAVDRVLYAGDWYEVIGEPDVVSVPGEGPHHIELQVRRIEG